MGVVLYATLDFPLLLLIFVLFCHINYNVSWCGPLRVDSFWSALCFLDLDVYFLSQVRKVFSNYVFKFVPCPFLLGLCNANISALDGCV